MTRCYTTLKKETLQMTSVHRLAIALIAAVSVGGCTAPQAVVPCLEPAAAATHHAGVPFTPKVLIGMDHCPKLTPAQLPVAYIASDERGYPYTGPMPKVTFSSTIPSDARLSTASSTNATKAVSVAYDGKDVHALIAIKSGRAGSGGAEALVPLEPGAACLHFSPAVVAVNKTTPSVVVNVTGTVPPPYELVSNSAKDCEGNVAIRPIGTAGTQFEIVSHAKTVYEGGGLCGIQLQKVGSAASSTVLLILYSAL